MNIKKVLILKNKDAALIRLTNGLTACGIHYDMAEGYDDIPNERYDIAFIDPGYDYDVSNKVRADNYIFYDSGDYLYPILEGVGYETMKHKIDTYAKWSYLPNNGMGYEHPPSNMKMIAIPMPEYVYLSQIARQARCEYNFSNIMPCFCGTPTYIGGATRVKHGIYNSSDRLGIKCLIPDPIFTGKYLYHQRIDWLLSLFHNNISYFGGICLPPDPSGLKKDFGNVGHLQYQRLHPIDWLKTLIRCQIGLSPTGNMRDCFRTWDIMAVGAILFRTDTYGGRSLYPPVEYITVKDGEDLGQKMLDMQKDFPDLLQAAKKNQEIFQQLTPEKIWNDFLQQLET